MGIAAFVGIVILLACVAIGGAVFYKKNKVKIDAKTAEVKAEAKAVESTVNDVASKVKSL